MRPEFESSDPRDPSVNPFPDEDAAWVTEEEIKALAEEREILGGDETAQAERILKENLPQITQSLVKLARSAQSESVRLNAAKYIVDRNLGRIAEPEPVIEDPLRTFMGEVVK
jgi:hypothetical protein